MTNFWLLESIKLGVLFGVAFALGLLVRYRGVRVNYTRKVFHFALFFTPIFLGPYLPHPAGLATTLLSGTLFLLAIAMMVEPVRRRSTFIATVFAAVDRPEDRPHTLLWISTQVLATYAVLAVILTLLEDRDRVVLVYMTVLVAGIGDGLAEPIGVRFGRHRYRVRGFFCDRMYTRSLEGSACVFASAVLACLALATRMSETELYLSLALLPPIMTLAEAFSPHTWDGPFLYLAGGSTTLIVLEIAARLAVP